MADTKKILVVEDEVFLLEIYIETLTDAGYKVDAASDGNKALEFLKHGGYDLVLLDVMLPGKDGQQILKYLQKNPPPHPIHKIVITTNLSDENIQKQFSEFKIAGSLTKSEVTPEEFLQRVKSYL